ncbi:hypothetical protein E8K88_16680 [Lampropedia aestuarii]|uniref:Uncharacterized protein n=1 Tax=Lampropedia aestuarii TaxID=2562762 RepID=A0A4S5BF25_9BURK|nr:hypothetical protein [Lampropedia aestuarii]THJ30907.1 hypothetical protein E8K88_16680 [Lampropedia aestuarii]
METTYGATKEGDLPELSALFYDKSVTTVRQSVELGYDKNTDKRFCQAVVHMQFPEGNAGAVLMGASVYGFIDTKGVKVAQGGSVQERIEFAVQDANTGEDHFYLNADMPGLVQLMGFGHSMFVVSHRRAGHWSGSYVCSGVDGATSGARGPFEQPVSFDVSKGSKAVLERSTQAGGYETINLELGQAVSGKGEGANSATDKWTVALQGHVDGTALQAKGQIKDLDGEVLRECTLQMTQTPAGLNFEKN